ncbi:MAG TPA: hypothetical protein VF510_23750 [Ktedonobacterales bacterium]
MVKRSHCRGWLALVLAVLAFIMADLAGCSGSTGTATSNMPTATVKSTGTAMTTGTATVVFQPNATMADPASLGWMQTGAMTPDAVAVAPGTPGTVVTCTGRTPHITLGISTDGGSTWKTQDTGISLARCMGLAVSPAGPNFIALYAGTCRSDCGLANVRLYFTTDAGAHWRQVTPTPDSDAGVIFGWVGTTFFASAAPNGTPTAAKQFLAVSRDGVHFAWTSLPTALKQILSYGSTVVVVASSTGSCGLAASLCTDLYRSTDLGTSWSHITPMYQGINVHTVAVVPGGSTLIGFDARAFADNPNFYPLLRSLDGGASWQPLPDMPKGKEASTDLPILTPDGTLYVFFCCGDSSASVADGIYKLAPGSASWALVSPVVPASIRLMAVSWDAQGHPAKLWGLHNMYPNTSAEDTDLWWHRA